MPSHVYDEDGNSYPNTLIDRETTRDVSLITFQEMEHDEWLNSWTLESLKWDNYKSRIGWTPTARPTQRFMYANSFAAVEVRCAEPREELANLISEKADYLLETRKWEFAYYRLAVAYTIWKGLPEGTANCTAYLNNLPAAEYRPAEFLIGWRGR